LRDGGEKTQMTIVNKPTTIKIETSDRVLFMTISAFESPFYLFDRRFILSRYERRGNNSDFLGVLELMELVPL
jgi:hypothetical protein